MIKKEKIKFDKKVKIAEKEIKEAKVKGKVSKVKVDFSDTELIKVKNTLSEYKNIDLDKIDLGKLNINSIKEQFIDFLEANLKTEVLSEKTSELSDLSTDVKRQSTGYVGFIFYVWNPNNLNIKIIPLREINPVLDIVNLKEMYFLYRPALFIDGNPVFLLIRGIPISFELKLIKNDNVIKEIELDGYTASEVRAKLRSGYTTYIFGKPSLSLQQLLFIIFLIISLLLLEYIIISTIFRSLIISTIIPYNLDLFNRIIPLFREN